MFTSRAEFRILFNHGSSELRYLNKLVNTNLVSKYRLEKIQKKNTTVNEWIERGNRQIIGQGQTLGDLIRKGRGVPTSMSEFHMLNSCTKDEILYRIKYDGYITRELKNIEKLKLSEKIKIPPDFNYSKLKGIRKECVEKLSRIKPETIAQASRISGVNPADITVLTIFLKRK